MKWNTLQFPPGLLRVLCGEVCLHRNASPVVRALNVTPSNWVVKEPVRGQGALGPVLSLIPTR
jgi:hypothetical protein